MDFLNRLQRHVSSSALAGDEDAKLRIPDVDLLEHMYEGTTVRLATNNEDSATITINTGVAEGCIASPQLFNIFINALLRMLTVTDRIRISVMGCRSARIRKETTSR